jgi:hypothetical protein
LFLLQPAHACFAWIEWLNRRAWYKISLLHVAFLHLADKICSALVLTERAFTRLVGHGVWSGGGYIGAGYSAAATGKLNLSLAGDGIANSKALMASVLCLRANVCQNRNCIGGFHLQHRTEHFTALTDFSLLIRTSKWEFHPIDVYLIGKPQRECNHQVHQVVLVVIL